MDVASKRRDLLNNRTRQGIVLLVRQQKDSFNFLIQVMINCGNISFVTKIGNIANAADDKPCAN